MMRELDHEADELVRLTSELVRIPTVNPPGNERAICEFIASWLTSRGVEAELLEDVPGRTNVQATIEGRLPGGRGLVLNGHVDVVPVGNGWTVDPFEGSVRNGRLYGRGSADMKGGVASMMMAAAVIRRHSHELSGRLTLQAVADEEVGTPIGTGYLVRRGGLDADLAIVGEPTGLEVCSCHKGVVRFEVTTFGKSAHSSVPWNGKSAILAMTRVVDALDGYGRSLATTKKPHPLLGSPTVNVGVIEGGVAVNFVPDRCRIVAERRLVPPETVEGASMEIRRVVSQGAKGAGVKYELVFNSKSKTSDASGEQERVGVVTRAAEAVMAKKTVKPRGFLATCDARFLSNEGGIPTVIFGPGSLSSVHAPDEFVEVSELKVASKVYALSFAKLQTSALPRPRHRHRATSPESKI